MHLNKFLAIYGKASSKQASKKTDFTVDLTWWGSLRLTPTSTTTVITLTTNAGTIPAVTDTHSSITTTVISTTSLNSPTLSSSSQSDNNNNNNNSNNSSSVGVIVAIVVLVIVVFIIIITVVVVGIIVVWKRKKSEHTKPEGVYYSTINETMLPRPPTNKPEAVYGEMNDGQDSKEPEYMDISKSDRSTEQAGKIIMQDNPAYSAEHQVKMQDNPAYSVTNM